VLSYAVLGFVADRILMRVRRWALRGSLMATEEGAR
jgi:hypothetical protein